MVIIFLDLDGVLLHSRYQNQIQPYLINKYQSLGLPRDEWNLSSKALDAAAVGLFDKNALANLDKLIATIEKSGQQVGIVITSLWRIDCSVERLINKFKQHRFASYIIDKTADQTFLIDKEIAFEKSLDRGEEIDIWLQQNTHKLAITDFLILDDVDCSMTRLFKPNFVKCENSFGDKELAIGMSLLDKTIKEDQQEDELNPHLLNKVFVKIVNKKNDRDVKTVAKLNLRVSLDNRSQFIQFFSNKMHHLPQRCSKLIAEYDDPRKESESNCLIM